MISLIICFFTITLLTSSLYGAVEPAVQYNYATELGELTKRVTAATTMRKNKLEKMQQTKIQEIAKLEEQIRETKTPEAATLQTKQDDADAKKSELTELQKQLKEQDDQHAPTLEALRSEIQQLESGAGESSIDKEIAGLEKVIGEKQQELKAQFGGKLQTLITKELETTGKRKLGDLDPKIKSTIAIKMLLELGLIHLIPREEIKTKRISTEMLAKQPVESLKSLRDAGLLSTQTMDNLQRLPLETLQKLGPQPK
jgi:hypothetical protein